MAIPGSLASYGIAATGPPPGPRRPLPDHVRRDLEIQQLCDKYQQDLVELNACHSLLVKDQERLTAMLARYVNEEGDYCEITNPDVLLFKDGLELRLQEFEEDCRRIQNLEMELQRRIDEATSDFEEAVSTVAVSTDSRIYKRLREQQRLIDLQQREIDQVRFEKEMLEQETRLLRERVDFVANDGQEKGQSRDAMVLRNQPAPRLHAVNEAHYKAKPVYGTNEPVRFSPFPNY